MILSKLNKNLKLRVKIKLTLIYQRLIYWIEKLSFQANTLYKNLIKLNKMLIKSYKN